MRLELSGITKEITDYYLYFKTLTLLLYTRGLLLHSYHAGIEKVPKIQGK